MLLTFESPYSDDSLCPPARTLTLDTVTSGGNCNSAYRTVPEVGSRAGETFVPVRTELFRIVLDLKYMGAGNFSSGLAPVRINDGWGGWGYIDPTGKVIITPQFDYASEFKGELAQVTADGRATYVNKSGTVVVDPFLAELSHVDAAHRETIKGWLKRNRGFTLATMADCTVCNRGEAWGAAKGEDFWDNKHPYYAVGDFNKDGQTDVAIVSKHGDLVIFNGPLRGDSNGQWVGNIVCGLATGMGQCKPDASGSYLYYKAQKDIFICGSYGTEVSCSVKPNGDRYLFHP